MIVFFLSPFLFPSSNFFHLQWGLKRGDFCQLFCGHVAHKGHLSETILTTTDVPSFSGLQSPHPHACGHIDRPKRGGSDGLFVCNILAKIEWAIFYSASRRAELLLHCSTFFSQTKTGKILFCHSSPLRLRAIVLLFCLPECDTWMPRRNSIIRCLDPALWLFWAWLNHYRIIWTLWFLEQLKSLTYACCFSA